MKVKESAFGNIPHDWIVKRFEDETDILTCGVAATPKYVDESVGIPFLSAQNVKEGKVILHKFKYISKKHHEELTKNNKPRVKDILYSRVGAKFGEAGVVEHDFEFSVYVSLTHIRVKPTSDPYYVKFLLNSEYVKNMAFRSVFQGAGVPNLNVKVVREFKLPFPPLPEQQKIAEVLSTVDAKIDIIDQQITETQELKKGLMQRLLTKGIGHNEFKDSPLGEIPISWEVEELTDLTSLITKGTTPTTNGFSYLDDGVNFVKVESIHSNGSFIPSMFAHVGNDCHDSFKRSQLSKGDILFTIAGALGRSAIVRKEILPANTNQAVAIIRLKNADNRNYIFHYLRGDYVKRLIEKINVSTAQANLSLGQINKFKIPIPPTNEQNKITEILSSIDDKLNILDDKKTNYQELKKGLMQQLLTGKVRVNGLINKTVNA